MEEIFTLRMANESENSSKLQLCEEMLFHFSSDWSYNKAADLKNLINGLSNWAISSNMQVSLICMRIIGRISGKMEKDFNIYLTKVLDNLAHMIGDVDYVLRDATQELILQLLKDTEGSLQGVLDQLMRICLSYDSLEIKRGALTCFIKTLKSNGIKKIKYQKHVQSICDLLKHQSDKVRDAGLDALADIYGIVGDPLWQDINKCNLTRSKIDLLRKKFEETCKMTTREPVLDGQASDSEKYKWTSGWRGTSSRGKNHKGVKDIFQNFSSEYSVYGSHVSHKSSKNPRKKSPKGKVSSRYSYSTSSSHSGKLPGKRRKATIPSSHESSLNSTRSCPDKDEKKNGKRRDENTCFSAKNVQTALSMLDNPKLKRNIRIQAGVKMMSVGVQHDNEQSSATHDVQTALSMVTNPDLKRNMRVQVREKSHSVAMQCEKTMDVEAPQVRSAGDFTSIGVQYDKEMSSAAENLQTDLSMINSHFLKRNMRIQTSIRLKTTATQCDNEEVSVMEGVQTSLSILKEPKVSRDVKTQVKPNLNSVSVQHDEQQFNDDTIAMNSRQIESKNRHVQAISAMKSAETQCDRSIEKKVEQTLGTLTTMDIDVIVSEIIKNLPQFKEQHSCVAEVNYNKIKHIIETCMAQFARTNGREQHVREASYDNQALHRGLGKKIEIGKRDFGVSWSSSISEVVIEDLSPAPSSVHIYPSEESLPSCRPCIQPEYVVPEASSLSSFHPSDVEEEWVEPRTFKKNGASCYQKLSEPRHSVPRGYESSKAGQQNHKICKDFGRWQPTHFSSAPHSKPNKALANTSYASKLIDDILKERIRNSQGARLKNDVIKESESRNHRHLRRRGGF